MTRRYFRIMECLPLHIQRIKRVVAREVNMDDLDEAMDHFLDVFLCFFSMGLRGPYSDTIFFLETASFVAHSLGPEVASGFHSIVKEACAEIRSVRLVNSQSDIVEQKGPLLSLGDILIKHTNIFQDYIVLHMKKHLELKGGMRRDGAIKIEVLDDGSMSID